jgi:hypothetical protein
MKILLSSKADSQANAGAPGLRIHGAHAVQHRCSNNAGASTNASAPGRGLDGARKLWVKRREGDCPDVFYRWLHPPSTTNHIR